MRTLIKQFSILAAVSMAMILCCTPSISLAVGFETAPRFNYVESSRLDEDSELLFSITQEGLPITSSEMRPYACSSKAIATVKAYKQSRNSESYIDLFITLSAPAGTCVRIKGVTDGEYRSEDLTSGSLAYTESFHGSQTVPSTVYSLWVDGTLPVAPFHSYSVSWDFKSWLYNGVESYYYGSQDIYS